MADINVTEEIIDINVTEEVITIEAPTGAYPFPNAVYSVFGRVGAIVAAEGDYNLTQLGDVTLTSPANGQVLKYNGTQWVNSTDADTGITTLNTLTALSQTFATGTSGTDFNISSASSTHTFNFPSASATNRGLLTSADWSNFNTAYNDSITSAAVTGTTTKTLTLNQQDGGTITASWTDNNTDAVTSVFGRTGAVVAQNGDYTTTQVTEGTNLYFTNTRAQNAITLTTTGTSGAATYSGGTLNIPQYQGVLTNPVTGTGTSGQISYFNGTSSITSDATFAFTPTSQLLVNNSVTASGAIARGTNLTPTLTAAANNDVLVGLDVNPTFTNGAFTGVVNYAARISGILAGVTQYMSTGASANLHYLQIVSSSSTNGVVNLLRNAGAAGTYAYQLNNGNGYFSINVGTGETTFGSSSGGYFTNLYSGGTEGLRIFGSTRNVVIQNGGTFTDAGYRLDVNGTIRSSGIIYGGTFTAGAGLQSTDFFATSGRVRAGGGISFRDPVVGDNINIGFVPTSTTTINVFSQNANIIQFDGAGSSTSTILNITPSFNPNSGTGNKSIFSILGQYNTSGTYSGGITGFLYSPILTSLTGVAYHRAIQTVTGDVLLCTTSGNVAIGTSTLGTATELTLGGSQTASSAIARGGLINTTLVAAANNDVLVGLDIAPTFTNGAFTNVANVPIRLSSVRGGFMWLGATATGNSGVGFQAYQFTTNDTTNIGTMIVAQRNASGSGTALQVQQLGTGLAFNVSNLGSSLFSSSITASSAIAQGVRVENTLVAAANNDLLVGLDINPTFTNGAFTGLTNSGIRVQGGSSNIAPSIYIKQTSNTSPTWFAIRNTDNNTGAGAISADLGIAGGTNQFFNGTSQGDVVFKAYSASNTSKFFIGATSTTTAQIVLFPSSGNTGINQTTDAGFRLDVNGTARVQGNITIGTNQIISGNTNDNGLIYANNSSGFGIQYNNTSTGAISGLYGGFGVININVSTNSTNTFLGKFQNVITNGTKGLLLTETSGDNILASAYLQINSTTKGFLPPRMTTTQKNAIGTPTAGLMVYDTTLNQMSYYNGTTWINF